MTVVAERTPVAVPGAPGVPGTVVWRSADDAERGTLTTRGTGVPVPPRDVRAALAAAGTGAVVVGVLGWDAATPSALLLHRDVERGGDPTGALDALLAAEPTSCGYRVPRPAPHPPLVGTSPGLLLARRGRTVRSSPVTGERPRGQGVLADVAQASALHACPLARSRHQHAVDAARGALDGLVRWQDPDPVGLQRTTRAWHLATALAGELTDPATTVLDLLAALRPHAALRSPGVVGWCDATGDGEWALLPR